MSLCRGSGFTLAEQTSVRYRRCRRRPVAEQAWRGKVAGALRHVRVGNTVWTGLTTSNTLPLVRVPCRLFRH